MRRPLPDAAKTLRAVKRELRRWIATLAAERRPDDRTRGQLETLRHLATVIENQERP